jgi:hypothetical protein
MKGPTLATIAIITTVIVMLSTVANAIDTNKDTFCLLSTARQDSRISITVSDGGYAYERVEGLIGSNKKAAWNVYINDAEKLNGTIDPVNKSSFTSFRLNLKPGQQMISVQIGADLYYYTVTVLNRTLEDKISSDAIGNITSPFKYTFNDILKAFLSAWVGLVAALVAAWIWLRDKIKQDVKVIL